jgi:hypothetical protein
VSLFLSLRLHFVINFTVEVTFTDFKDKTKDKKNTTATLRLEIKLDSKRADTKEMKQKKLLIIFFYSFEMSETKIARKVNKYN